MGASGGTSAGTGSRSATSGGGKWLLPLLTYWIWLFVSQPKFPTAAQRAIDRHQACGDLPLCLCGGVLRVEQVLFVGGVGAESAFHRRHQPGIGLW